MVVGYLIVAFVVFFITYKLNIEKFKEEAKSSSKYSTEEWVARKSFWIMALIPPFWILSIPCILAWKILDKVYNKLTNK